RPSGCVCTPAVCTKQGYEADWCNLLTLQGLASSHYHLQNLLLRRADGNEHSPTLPQLADQRLGPGGRPRAHQNRGGRRRSPPAERAVTRQVGNVAELEFGEDFHGQVQKRLDPLDSEYLGAQLREQGCLVSRSRADLQNTLGTFQLQQLQVPGMNGRLRDGLSAADWERGVLVGTVPYEDSALPIGSGQTISQPRSEEHTSELQSREKL